MKQSQYKAALQKTSVMIGYRPGLCDMIVMCDVDVCDMIVMCDVDVCDMIVMCDVVWMCVI